MANNANEDWGWRVDLKSWFRWLIYDQIYDSLRSRVGRTSMADLVAAGVVLYAYLRGHSGLLLFALGAMVASNCPLLKALGWNVVPFRAGLSLSSLERHAVTELPTDNCPADYALVLGGRLVGIIEAKKLSLGPQKVLTQAERYAHGLDRSFLGLPTDSVVGRLWN